MNKKVCIVGLGYVGITLALAFAKKGQKIIGYDHNNKILTKLKSGKTHIFEKGLERILKSSLRKKTFQITNSIPNKCDFYIVTVGTPITKDKRSKKYVANLNEIKKVSNVLKNKIASNSHIIYRSTLPVGTTRNTIIPIFAKSGKKTSFDYKISFAPERTIEGDAVNELYKIPQLIAGYDKKTGLEAAKLFKKINKKIILLDKLEEAEIIKLINNTYRDISFAYANQIAMICSSLNIPANKLIKLSNYEYPRNKIPLASPGVGGPCLTKDPFIFETFLKSKKHSIFSIGREINNKITANFCKSTIKNFTNVRKVLICGLSFKGEPPTKDLRGSSSLEMVKFFRRAKKNTFCFDPLFTNDEIKKLGFKPMEKKERFDLIIVANNNKFFGSKKFTKLLLKITKKKSRVYDCWEILDKEVKKKFIYRTIGEI